MTANPQAAARRSLKERAAERLRLRIEVLGRLAYRRQEAGRYQESEILYRHALKIGEGFLPADDLAIAGLLNGLGILRKYQGRYDDAEPVYRRALTILEAALGTGHPDLASLYHNLGGLEHARGRARGLGVLLEQRRERQIGQDIAVVNQERLAA